jgi:hypothetical protein
VPGIVPKIRMLAFDEDIGEKEKLFIFFELRNIFFELK